MSEKRDPKDPAALAIGPLAHEMNNALAYVVTNLNLLREGLEKRDDAESLKLHALVEDALDGSGRIGELIRSMRKQGWGPLTVAPTDVPTDPGEGDAPPPRVLVVDDEPAILVAVTRALSHYDVVTAASGEQALEALASSSTEGSPLHLVLCDLVMPGLGGIGLYHRALAEHPELTGRFLFMTGGAFTPELRAFLARVPNPVLHKPFDAKTLRWVVGRSVASHEEPRA